MKTLEEQIKELRNSFPSLSAISTDSNNIFQSKYGPNGSGGKAQFNGVFVPGKIYISEYFTKSKPSKINSYIDRSPIFLYLKTDKTQNGNVLYGLNLNVIPPDYRGMVILRIWNQFSNIINENEKTSGEQPIPDLYNSLKILLNGTGWQNSLTGFKPDFLRNVKIVDYPDWVRIPYISMTKIEGQTIPAIYNDYRSKLNP